ncbi:Adenylate cyclase [Actinacidiphila bryophytorum]|uniref:Adenylate cyclase n=1 Tax=Actinacidiphila bryophytorum TaxID=1436133 RepID=A0A9W4MJR6_9ACTN|nr:Adenylate cyclase [Actinacidiphila bryophytorum]
MAVHRAPRPRRRPLPAGLAPQDPLTSTPPAPPLRQAPPGPGRGPALRPGGRRLPAAFTAGRGGVYGRTPWNTVTSAAAA